MTARPHSRKACLLPIKYIAAFLLLLAAVPCAAGLSDGDRALLRAHAAFRAGDRQGLARAAEKVGEHVLAPYADFWQLKLRLDEAPAEEVRRFLEDQEGTVLADILRREWLRGLAKKGEWVLFQQEHPRLVKEDPEIACYALQGEWLSGREIDFGRLEPFWNAARPLPEGCLAPAEALLGRGAVSEGRIAFRFRLLIEAGLAAEAKRLAAFIPGAAAAPAGQIDALLKDPARFLEGCRGKEADPFGRELVIAAVLRLARQDPAAAAGFWEGLRPEGLPLPEVRAVWAQIAAWGGRHHLPEARDWFDRAGTEALTDLQLAWQARAALRREDWAGVKAAVERMSPRTAQEPVWIYWLGRALCSLGKVREGRALWEGIAGGHHFYGRLAAEELGLPLVIPPHGTPPAAEELKKVEETPGIRRALALFRLGLRSEGTLEWGWGIKGMDDQSLLAAAGLARDNKVWDRAIFTAERTTERHDFRLRYLAPYRDVLGRSARKYNLDEDLILGLVRQESRFVAEAHSSAGAVGLMQLIPSTASWAAKKLKMKGFSASRLSLPPVNAALGSFYLRKVLDAFGGSLPAALAAYNAGPMRARRWLAERPLEGAIYVETIPYTETRLYVQKVLTGALYYGALEGRRHSLKALLGRVEARGRANGQAEREEIP